MFHLKRRLFHYLCYGLGDVDVFKRHEFGGVVQSVQRRDVGEQACQPLALRIASVEELFLGVFVHFRVADDGLQVSLYARHGRLQLVCYVLGELPFQHVLLLLGVLQALVYLYDVLRYLSQLVGRELDKVFGVEAFVVVGSPGEYPQLGDVVVEPAYEAV